MMCRQRYKKRNRWRNSRGNNYLSFSGALSSFIKSGGCGLSFKMEAKSQDMLKFLKYTMNF